MPRFHHGSIGGTTHDKDIFVIPLLGPKRAEILEL